VAGTLHFYRDGPKVSEPSDVVTHQLIWMSCV